MHNHTCSQVHCRAHTHRGRSQWGNSHQRTLLHHSSHWFFFDKYINNKMVIKLHYSLPADMEWLISIILLPFPKWLHRSQNRFNVLMCNLEHLHSRGLTAHWDARLRPLTGCHVREANWLVLGWPGFKSWLCHFYHPALGKLIGLVSLTPEDKNKSSPS